MKMTLLEMVQAILAAMDSEEINSITDTVEANQVALICKGVYYDIVEDVDMPVKHTLFQLNASGDNNIPCLMTVPADVAKVLDVRYNYTATPGATPDYRVMQLLNFDDFMARQQPALDSDTNVGMQVVTKGGETFQFWYRNNADPTLYTTFDDNTLLFDSYDATKEDTLQKNKTMCTGREVMTFLMQDSFIVDLDGNQFPYYLNKCKGRAFNELKQQVNQEAVAETRRQKIMQQKRKQKTEAQPAVFDHARYGKSGFLGGVNTTIPKSLRNGS